MGGDEDPPEFIDLLLQFQHREVEGVDQQVRDLVQDVFVLVHHQLVAELVHIVLEKDDLRIQESLELGEFFHCGHETQAMDLFLGGHLRAHQHVETHLLPRSGR